jgi:FkbM family methyltransferase
VKVGKIRIRSRTARLDSHALFRHRQCTLQVLRMIVVSSLMKIYRNYRLKILVDKILENWNIKFTGDLSAEDRSIIKEIFYHKLYSPFFPFYKECVVVDIGAHKGFFALYAAVNCSPQSKIICMEPASDNFTDLLKNIDLNGIKNVRAVHKGLLSKDGEMTLYLYSAANNSVFREYEGIINKEIKTSETVPAITLPQLCEQFQIEAIDFLKLDCEGSEYDILYNLDASLFEKIAVISLEFHDLNKPEMSGHALASFLSRMGYMITKFSYLQTISRVNSGHIIGVNKRLVSDHIDKI